MKRMINHKLTIKEQLINALDKILDKEGIYPLCEICDTEKCNIYEHQDFDMLYPLCCKKLLRMADSLINKNIIREEFKNIHSLSSQNKRK